MTRIREVQKTVIDANTATPQGVTDAFAVPFVKFTRAALLSIDVAPGGWRDVVGRAWGLFKVELSPALQAQYKAYLLLIDTILA